MKNKTLLKIRDTTGEVLAIILAVIFGIVFSVIALATLSAGLFVVGTSIYFWIYVLTLFIIDIFIWFVNSESFIDTTKNDFNYFTYMLLLIIIFFAGWIKIEGLLS